MITIKGLHTRAGLKGTSEWANARYYHYITKVIKKGKDSTLLITSGNTNASILSLFDRYFGFLVLPLENLIKE
jgi:hypothetical protein